MPLDTLLCALAFRVSCQHAHFVTSQPEVHCSLRKYGPLCSHKAAESSIIAVGTVPKFDINDMM